MTTIEELESQNRELEKTIESNWGKIQQLRLAAAKSRISGSTWELTSLRKGCTIEANESDISPEFVNAVKEGWHYTFVLDESDSSKIFLSGNDGVLSIYFSSPEQLKSFISEYGIHLSLRILRKGLVSKEKEYLEAKSIVDAWSSVEASSNKG